MSEQVKKIVDVSYEVEKSNPPNLIVTAMGEVPTAGWENTQLLRREYVTPPIDGIWEYDLVSEPPKGPAAQVISVVHGTNTWKAYDADNVKGVRVYGEGDGIKEVKFGES